MKHGLNRTGIISSVVLLQLEKLYYERYKKNQHYYFCLFYNQYAIFYHYGFKFSFYPTGVK